MIAIAKGVPRAADTGRTMRRLVPLFTLLCLAVAAMPATAGAAGKTKAKVPTIKRVSPMRQAVGRTLTIRGKNFSSSRRKNTVVFRGPGKRSAFAKPRRASRKKLVVRVPGSVERLLKKSGTKRVATRFSLRVVTKRYGKLTKRRRSPVIVSATESGDLDCGNGADFDGDLLSNSREKALGTDPCLKDTDGDGSEDYFEVESALDINQRAVPYPGRRPYTNPLDPSDAGHDYDGDGLSNAEESRMWARAAIAPPASLLQTYSNSQKAPAFEGPYGGTPRFGNHSPELNYSDGLQATTNPGIGSSEYKSYLDFNRNGFLTDNERDADGDGLANVEEIRVMMWEGHYPAGEDCGYEYKPVLPRVFLQVDYMNWDTDGDGVWDGNDDQDSDDVSNVDEIRTDPSLVRPDPLFTECEDASPLPINAARDGSAVLRHPYNPCLPDRFSDTCARYGLRD